MRYVSSFDGFNIQGKIFTRMPCPHTCNKLHNHREAPGTRKLRPFSISISREEIEQAWVEDAKTRLSRINETARKADLVATIQLRQLISRLIVAKAEPEQHPIGEAFNKSKKAPDSEFRRIIKEKDKEITAETELEETQLKNDTHAILETILAMKASQLYKVAKDLKSGKTIAEIKNLHAQRKPNNHSIQKTHN